MTSGGAPKPATASLIVRSNADTEVFLIDGRLGLTANGVGKLETRQAPGVYKVKCVRAGVVKEQLLELHADKPVEINLPVDDIQTVGPSISVLGPDAMKFFELVGRINAAYKPETGHTPAASSAFYLFASAPADNAGSPLRGVRIFPWRARARAREAPALQADTTVAGGRTWAGVRLTPATEPEVLEFTIDGSTVRQMVPQIPGREVRIHVRRRNWIDAVGEPGVSSASGRSEWIDVAVQYRSSALGYAGVTVENASQWPDMHARANPSGVELEHSVRVALAGRRRLALNASLVDRLLWSKYEDPYAGLAGAHLMFDAIEERTARLAARKDVGSLEIMDFPPEVVSQVVRNLAGLFGFDSASKAAPTDPDLAAIFLRAGRPFEGRLDVRVAPLYWRSWETLLHHSTTDRGVWIEPKLWSEIKFSAAWGPYLGWQPHRLSVGDYIDRVMHFGAKDESPPVRASSMRTASAEALSGAPAMALRPWPASAAEATAAPAPKEPKAKPGQLTAAQLNMPLSVIARRSPR